MPVTENARTHTTVRIIVKLLCLVLLALTLAGINSCNNTRAIEVKTIEGRIDCVQQGRPPLECREIFPR